MYYNTGNHSVLTVSVNNTYNYHERETKAGCGRRDMTKEPSARQTKCQRDERDRNRESNYRDRARER